MSCGQIPEKDDICAGDRLGHLLNRARHSEAGRGALLPAGTPSHGEVADDDRVHVCTDDPGDATPALAQHEGSEVRR